jgi:multisubunit Na+/H+ antiporter MnhB subunit
MTTSAILLLDILLVLSLLTLAAATVTANDARRGVILFMALGLVLALAWARLHAPDLALAEAAIGAGLSGALLLAAVPEQQRRVSSAGPKGSRKRNQTYSGVLLRWTLSVLCAALAGVLVWALASAFDRGPQDTLAQAVSNSLGNSGVSNPVTAVLLNFRAYDTLLELAVLLTAVLGIMALGPARPGYRAAGPVYDSLTRGLVPLLILAAAYLLWVGAHAPGGAFQAGATLAAAGVVLRLAGRDTIGLPHRGVLRPLLAAGVAMFLVVGWSLLVSGRPFLSYPPDWAGGLILLIESAAMLAIAATLVVAFLGGRPPAQRDRRPGGNGKTDPVTAPGTVSTQRRHRLDTRLTGSPEHRSKENEPC